MTTYVFLGSTLEATAVRGVIDAVVLPPVQQGDVYRLTLRRPQAIGIVDGRFQDVPAVWHKEILWAITQGVPVYGSASMGALRAAELSVFGMRGVGWVFEAYRDGAIEDDDEVAVSHGSRDEGFAVRSEAMVNIRRTLAAAQLAGVVGAHTGAALADLVKAEFYPLRSYPLMLRLGRQVGLPTAELDALATWLPAHRVDQKRADAIAMLRVMADDLAAGEPVAPGRFTFQHTEFFEHVRLTAGDVVLEGRDGHAETDDVTLDDLVAELRLDPDAYLRVRDRAVARCLAVREAQRTGAVPSEGDVRAAATRFRRARSLLAVGDAERWLADNHLNLDRFTALMREEAALSRAVDAVDSELAIYLRNQLRVDGGYPELVARLRAKRRSLSEQGLDDSAVKIDDAQYEDLVRWYFRRLGTTPPSDVDTFWRSLGFSDETDFRRALLRESWFVQTPEAPTV